MIVGLGSDIVDIRRIERTLERFGERFAERVFTDGERALAATRARPGESLARRWAAKEACAKALGVGLCTGVAWREIDVRRDARGKPSLALDGGAANALAALMPPGKAPHLHLTMSDEPPYAQAVVVIEARDPVTTDPR